MVFSRKTWYLMLAISTALSMSAGFAALAGQDISMLNVVAFGVFGLAVLFLAAEKENTTQERARYFQSFVLGMLGYVLGGLPGLIGAGLAWPLLLYIETKRGAPITQQLQLLILAEGMYALLWLLASSGVQQVYFFVNLFAVLKAVARGWAAFILCRMQRDESAK